MRRLILAIVLCILAASCNCIHQLHYCDEPPKLPDCNIPDRIRLALVLGGGGVRGLAHVGVLEEFEKAGIPIDLIIGCSAGSLVGVLYADNPNADDVWEVVNAIKPINMIDLNIFQLRYGISEGKKFQQMLERSLSARTFNQLKIPLLVVATDLYSSELVTFGGGDIIPAVRASCAIPFFYKPVQHYNRVLVDGSVIDPVPARIAKGLNAEIVVAVDLRGLLPHTIPTDLFEIALRSAEITLLWQSETCIHCADFVIRPEIEDDVGTFDCNNNNHVYEAGKAAARQMIPDIIALLEAKALDVDAKATPKINTKLQAF